MNTFKSIALVGFGVILVLYGGFYATLFSVVVAGSPAWWGIPSGVVGVVCIVYGLRMYFRVSKGEGQEKK